MKIILLSGGSGKRLWPLSNNVRSKQFLKLLPSHDGMQESMIQRVVRQIFESGITDSITIATGDSQLDQIRNQLGDEVNVVTEPARRDTFPAIALAATYLREHNTPPDEPIVVMPCDVFTEKGYFTTIDKMAKGIQDGIADLILMGITPSVPSAKFGYIVPASSTPDNWGAVPVKRFFEKPKLELAIELIEQDAFWNGGVFAFRLDYLMSIIDKYTHNFTFPELRNQFDKLPKISFDYEVVEKADSIAMIPYRGMWKDLGTWDTLTEQFHKSTMGNSILSPNSSSTHIINELDVPIVCVGTNNLIVAASPDGILVTNRENSNDIKDYVADIDLPPMFEEGNWGNSKILSIISLGEDKSAITKQVHLKKDRIYECHALSGMRRTLNFIDGEAIIEVDKTEYKISHGEVINIQDDQRATIKSITPVDIIEISIS